VPQHRSARRPSLGGNASGMASDPNSVSAMSYSLQHQLNVSSHQPQYSDRDSRRVGASPLTDIGAPASPGVTDHVIEWGEDDIFSLTDSDAPITSYARRLSAEAASNGINNTSSLLLHQQPPPPYFQVNGFPPPPPPPLIAPPPPPHLSYPSSTTISMEPTQYSGSYVDGETSPTMNLQNSSPSSARQRDGSWHPDHDRDRFAPASGPPDPSAVSGGMNTTGLAIPPPRNKKQGSQRYRRV